MLVSELDLTNAFESSLGKSWWSGEPLQRPLVRELDCINAFPDILAVTAIPEMFSAPLTPCMAQLISLLQEKGLLEFERLVELAGRSRASVLSAIYQLEADCWVDISPDRSVLLRPRKDTDSGKLWSFELKLENWKRALYQATRNQAFADYSVVVLPIGKMKVAEIEQFVFQKLGIGLLVFDEKTLEGRWIVEPRLVAIKNPAQSLLVRTRFSSAFYSENIRG